MLHVINFFRFVNGNSIILVRTLIENLLRRQPFQIFRSLRLQPRDNGRKKEKYMDHGPNSGFYAPLITQPIRMQHSAKP